VAVNALREIDVYPAGDFKMTLGEYLLMRGELHEFLMANLLHDLGHPPLSHVLEINPFIELDHEEITRNLILGKPTEEGKMDWYIAERFLLKMKAIKDFEYRFFENKYDPIYEIDDKVAGKEEEFLNSLEKNEEILESEIVTVTEVLDNFGVDKKRIVEILSGKIFCPRCHKLVEMIVEIIENNKIKYRVKCPKCGEVDIKPERIYDTQFLNELVDSDIDFDRIDHVKRDSDICGLSLTSFRLLELLGSISIVLPGSNAHKEVYEAEENKPYIFVSEDGLKYVMDLLNTRRLIFNEVLYSDENNWINGVVNQITALAIEYIPYLKLMLPFITDQILAHLYINTIFLGDQIEKLNKLFHGKMDNSAYGKPMKFKLKEKEIITETEIVNIYRKLKEENEKYASFRFPVIIFYTNIRPTKCPFCGKRKLKEENGKYFCEYCGRRDIRRDDIHKEEENWDDILVYARRIDASNGQKYCKFVDLVKKDYQGISRERFPKKPSESDVKDILYVWINNFFVSVSDEEENSGDNPKRGWDEWKNKIIEEIGMKDKLVDLNQL